MMRVSIDNGGIQDKRGSMIRLTDSAVSAVEKLLGERAEPGQKLRMFISAGGCSGFEYGMEFAHPSENDVSMEDNGIAFLVDKKSLEKLDGSEVDYDDGLTGKGFEIRNPQASSTCGCGRSFAS